MTPLKTAVALLAIVSLPTILFAEPPPPPPILMVHYMPMYQSKALGGSWGWHWTMNHYNPETFDEQGRRRIASHYYPLIGPYDSRDADLVEYHVLLMKVAGIDGAIADWDGSSSLYDYPLINSGTIKLFNALSAAGLRFAVCYEDQTITQLINNGRITADQAVEQGQRDMTYVLNHWANQPAYLTLDGKPVVLNFGPQYFYSEPAWAAILSVFSAGAQFFPLNNRLGTVAAGAFPWPPMWLSVGGVLAPEVLHQYLDDFYSSATTWPIVVGGAVPGFHDIYQEAGVQPSYGYLDARNGLTFSETLDRALLAHPQVIQIVTWNDFNEGTNIEPTQEYGYQYLEYVQNVARGFHALPYTSEDLALPYTLYGLRKAHHGDAPVMALLSQAAAFIVSGEPARARAIFAALQTSVAILSFDAVLANRVVTLQSTFRPDLGVEAVNVYRGLGTDGDPLTIIGRADDVRSDGFEYVDREVVPGQTYRYQIGVVDTDGEFFSPIVTVAVGMIARRLEQNRPNPFNPTTTIGFVLPGREDVTLAIYDAEGRLVRTLVNEVLGYGPHEVTWNGRDDEGAAAKSGVYFYRLRAGTLAESKKMVLSK